MFASVDSVKPSTIFHAQLGVAKPTQANPPNDERDWNGYSNIKSIQELLWLYASQCEKTAENTYTGCNHDWILQARLQKLMTIVSYFETKESKEL